MAHRNIFLLSAVDLGMSSTKIRIAWKCRSEDMTLDGLETHHDSGVEGAFVVSVSGFL